MFYLKYKPFASSRNGEYKQHIKLFCWIWMFKASPVTHQLFVIHLTAASLYLMFPLQGVKGDRGPGGNPGDKGEKVQWQHSSIAVLFQGALYCICMFSLFKHSHNNQCLNVFLGRDVFLFYFISLFCFSQGPPGPPGYPGAAGAMGAPVSVKRSLSIWILQTSNCVQRFTICFFIYRVMMETQGLLDHLDHLEKR